MKSVVAPLALWECRQLFFHCAAQMRIEIGERLVHQDGARALRQAPRQSHPLALATGKFSRLALPERCQSHRFQALRHTGRHRAPPFSRRLQWKGDIGGQHSCAATAHRD